MDPVIGREDEIERVTQILTRRKKNNPVLLGTAALFILDGKLLIVTLSDPLPAVLAVAEVPLPSTVTPVAFAILTITPAAGTVVGKLSSSAIASKPPRGVICADT